MRPREIDHVRQILGLAVALECHDAHLDRRCRERGAASDGYGLRFEHHDRGELARTLTWLQSEGVPFLDEPGGWPPAAVFDAMRDEGLVSGRIRRVSWLGPNEPVFTES
jgi:hypothetical protein